MIFYVNIKYFSFLFISFYIVLTELALINKKIKICYKNYLEIS